MTDIIPADWLLKINRLVSGTIQCYSKISLSSNKYISPMLQSCWSDIVSKCQREMGSWITRICTKSSNNSCRFAIRWTKCSSNEMVTRESKVKTHQNWRGRIASTKNWREKIYGMLSMYTGELVIGYHPLWQCIFDRYLCQAHLYIMYFIIFIIWHSEKRQKCLRYGGYDGTGTAREKRTVTREQSTGFISTTFETPWFKQINLRYVIM